MSIASPIKCRCQAVLRCRYFTAVDTLRLSTLYSCRHFAAVEASIWELNSRLREKGQAEITIKRFRPNIIVRGATTLSNLENGQAPKAWSEDSWKTVRILNHTGENKTGITGLLGGGDKGLDIDVQAKCARCQFSNVNSNTAEKDNKEPWDTLVSYRRVDEGIKWKPCFGMLNVPRMRDQFLWA